MSLPLAAAVPTADHAHFQIAADKSVDGVLTGMTTQVTVIAMSLAGLMCVVLGIKVMISLKGGQSFREAVQNLGILGLGIAIVSGGALILGAVTSFVSTINK